MGLSSFNRMRRERNGVEKIEAEKFKNWNEARHASRDVRDEATGTNAELNHQAAEAELAAVKAIGEKVEAGLKSGDKKGGVIDEPLRRDHAAEIAGRNIEGVQEPKDPVARREERVPDGTANEELVPHTQVDRDGPSPEMVEAAQAESGVIKDDADADHRDDDDDDDDDDHGDDPEVVIPKGWADLGAADRRALASKISGQKVKKAFDADKIITAEEKKRAS